MNTNGNSLPANTGTLTARGEAGDGLVSQQRPRDQQAQPEQDDRADLHEGRQVVAGGEQHPHRKHRRHEAVDDQAQHERLRREREGLRESGVLDVATTDQCEEQQADADNGGLHDPARPHVAQVEPHEERDRDRHRDREGRPRRLRHRVDDDQRQDGEQDDHDREDAEQSGHTAEGADLLAGHLSEALAVATHRQEQDHHVLHGAGDDDADDDPDGSRQVAHLRGEHRAHERPGTGDRSEVVPEEHPPVGRLEVHPVVEPLGRGGPGVVDLQDLAHDELGVEAVGDRVGAERGAQQPDGRDLLVAGQGDDAPAHSADDGDGRPDDDLAQFVAAILRFIRCRRLRPGHGRHAGPPGSGDGSRSAATAMQTMQTPTHASWYQ
jgi:hypothetical protein